MADYGGIACTFVRGASLPLQSTIDFFHTPGMDGLGAHDLGKGQSAFEFQLVLFDTLANISVWVGNLLALKGALVTVMDDFGQTHANLLAERFTIPVKTPAVHATGGYRAEMTVRGRVVA